MKKVTIKAPGSTSNFGSGFDTLGMAINLYQTVTLTSNNTDEIRLLSGGGPKLEAMVREASRLACEAMGVSTPGFDLELGGDLPAGKGLGASGALRVGLVAALGFFTGESPWIPEVLNIATAIDHHPDNVSPALLGGFTVSSMVGREVTCISVPVEPQVRFGTAIPDFDMDTEEARKLIPPRFSKADTAHALNRAAMITAAFTTRKYEKLRGLFDDRFHQPCREKLLPQLSEVIRAAEKAGAIGGWLSGAGSGIMCLSRGNHEEVAEAMSRAMPRAKILILEADNNGLQMDFS